MIRLRTLGLALVAVFAISAVVASAASAALPRFSSSGVCIKANAVVGWPTFTTGSVWYYGGSTCSPSSHTAPAAGAFALGTGAFGLSPFYSESEVPTETALLETVGGSKVECKGTATEPTVRDLGELTAERSNREVVRFVNCVSSGVKCTTAGAATGEIVTNLLASKPVYLTEAETAAGGVGIALTPATAGGLFAKFVCGGLITVEVGESGSTSPGQDSIVCPITPLNKPTFKYTLACAQTKGVQAPTGYYEGGTFHSDYLESKKTLGSWEQSGERTTDVITTAAEGEIEA